MKASPKPRPTPPRVPSRAPTPSGTDLKAYIGEATAAAVARSDKYRRQHVRLAAADQDRLREVSAALGSTPNGVLNAAVPYAAWLHAENRLSLAALRAGGTEAGDGAVRKIPFTPTKQSFAAWLPFGDKEMLSVLARAGLRALHSNLLHSPSAATSDGNVS